MHSHAVFYLESKQLFCTLLVDVALFPSSCSTEPLIFFQAMVSLICLGAVMEYFNIVLENGTCKQIRFQCNTFYLVNKMFVTPDCTSKAQKKLLFKL